jgi:hypothetical protein
VAAALAVFLAAATSLADSFTPVRLTITVAGVARLHKPLAISVHVSADPGVLDTRTGPLRAQVKLASECGGTFQYTSGPVLLDTRLSPQPATGQAYAGSAQGSGRPATYGTQTVCVWINDEGDSRTFASDQSVQVDVSPACTRAAARYDAARKARHRSAIARARRAARSACGPGVPL